jgi:NAD(P)-dependent dehydrogenase (short-subunit alcohol dehydrogenase family)
MGRVIATQLAADGFDVAVAYAGSIDLADATVGEINTAVDALTRILAKDLRGRDITVNAVAPFPGPARLPRTVAEEEGPVLVPVTVPGDA